MTADLASLRLATPLAQALTDALLTAPGISRAAGLALHLGAVVGVFFFGRRLTGRADTAGWAATLFAALPVTSEAVLSAAGRGSQLATLTVLAALTLHTSPDRRGRIPGLMALSAIGVAADPTALALAPLLLVHDALVAPPGPLRRAWTSFAATATPALVPLLAMPGGGAVGRPWAVTAFLAEGFGRALVPHTQTIFWVPEPPAALMAGATTLAAALACVGLVALRRRAPGRPAWRLFGLAWWCFALGPLLPVAFAGDPVPERALYLATVGPSLWLGGEAAGFLRWFRHIGRGRLAATLLAVIVFLLGARTAIRTQDWRDDFLIHLSAVEDEPDNPEALFRFGTHLALNDEWLAAPRILSRAHQMAPLRVDVSNNLAVTLIRRGNWEPARRLLEDALVRDPGARPSQHNLAQVRRRHATDLVMHTP